jgi:hypothetical protein
VPDLEEPYASMAKLTRWVAGRFKESLDQDTALEELLRAFRAGTVELTGCFCIWDGIHIWRTDQQRRVISAVDMIDLEIVTSPDGEMVAMPRESLPLRIADPARTVDQPYMYRGSSCVDPDPDEPTIGPQRVRGFSELMAKSVHAKKQWPDAARRLTEYSEPRAKALAEEYVAAERAAGRQPTKAGRCRASEKQDKKFSRRVLHLAFTSAGGTTKVGRPNKPRK